MKSVVWVSSVTRVFPLGFDTPAALGGGTDKPAYAFQLLIIDSLKQMRDAESNKHLDTAFVFLRHVLLSSVPYGGEEVLKKYDADWRLYFKEYDKIDKNTLLNDGTKEKRFNELKKSFYDAHLYDSYRILSRIGVVQAEEEGMIDFEKLSIDKITTIVRMKESNIVDEVKKVSEFPDDYKHSTAILTNPKSNLEELLENEANGVEDKVLDKEVE